MVARAEAMVAIPDGLASVDAAPLLCAGATSLGALRASVARGGDLVAIHGFGGLGHLAVQFAAKLGFRPVVISRGREKEPLARKLGAREYIDAAAGETAKELQRLGGARVILCTAPSGKAITGLLGGLGRGGQMMIVTFPGDPVIVPAGLLLGMKRSIAGWVGGNMEDTIRFSMLTGVAPMIEEFPLEQAALAYDKMMTAKVHFRSVLKMAK
jgi:D-arabinose 1-dehydrogenase-like Zn-dependent alcohol dehydrogenase